MNRTAITGSFTRIEIASLVAASVVAAVLLGPGAITVSGVDSIWVEVLSAVFVGLLVFTTGALSLWAVKQQ